MSAGTRTAEQACTDSISYTIFSLLDTLLYISFHPHWMFNYMTTSHVAVPSFATFELLSTVSLASWISIFMLVYICFLFLFNFHDRLRFFGAEHVLMVFCWLDIRREVINYNFSTCGSIPFPFRCMHLFGRIRPGIPDGSSL